MNLNFNLNLKTVIVSAVILTIVDAVYLYSTKKYFNSVVKSIQGKDITMKYTGAFLCYLCLVFGLNYFVLSDIKTKDEDKIKNAFVLGLIIYAVFDTTTYAIFDNWTVKAVVMDSLWGGILFATTTFLTLKFIKK